MIDFRGNDPDPGGLDKDNLAELNNRDFSEYAKTGNKQWSSMLYSNKDLFRRTTKRPMGVIGPTLTDNNIILGDMFAMESAFFYGAAGLNPIQHAFYKFLLKTNLTRAEEYLLVMTEAIGIWRDDIRKLSSLLGVLESEEQELAKEEKESEHILHLREVLDTIPDTVKRHFPGIFDKIGQDYNNVKNLVSDLIEAVKNIDRLRNMLDNYLKQKKIEMPFLFEK